MQIIKTLSDWKKRRSALGKNTSLGFVPTMGCLHDGHASLLKQSLTDNDQTVLSIFVNPTQFNDPNDFTHYPNTLETDLKLAADLGVDYVLLPNRESMYPNDYTIRCITDDPFAMILEGSARPGHFNGVLSILLKLFSLIQADRAYFGEKDYQQCYLTKKLVESYFIPTTIIAMPTVREADGLPYSSRNKRLSPAEREIASQFARTVHNAELSIQQIRAKLADLPLSLDYLEHHHGRLFVAARIGDIRILDNLEKPSC